MSRRDSFLHERIPVVAVGALPQQLGTAIAAAHAHVRIEIEHRVPRQFTVSIDERRLVMELTERAPDGLVDAERVGVLHERGEQQIKGFARMRAGCQVPGQCESGAPVLRVVADEAAAEPREPFGRGGPDRQGFESIEREIRTVRSDRDQPFLGVRGGGVLCLQNAHVAQVQIRRHRTLVEVNRSLEPADGFGVVHPAHGLEPDLVLEKRENGLVLRPSLDICKLREPLAGVVGFQPLVLFFMQLLQVHQGIFIFCIKSEDLVERLGRTIDKATPLVVQSEAQEHVRVFEFAELGPLQQRLVDRNRLADLAFLAIQVAEDHVYFERVGVERRGLRQLGNRKIDLVGDQKVEAEQVVGRLAGPSPVEPLSVAQLVAFPRLADGQPDEQGDERREE